MFILLFINSWGKELATKSKLKNENLLFPIKVIINNSDIYIFDKGDESLKIFDRKGNMMNKFGKKGGGPGEFLCATDFCIYKGKVYIIDTCQSKLEIFSAVGKHLQSAKIKVSNPFKIAVDNGKIFISTLALLEGQKIITSLVDGREPKVIKSFLDCIPIKGLDLNAIYKNSGIITAKDEKLYFAFTLSNKVLEFSQEGEILKEYLLPLKPIDKPEIDRKANKLLLKSALNYDIRAKGDKVYLLSRNREGNSLIFEFKNGKFSERFKIEEKLVSFDITEDEKELWGIEEEEGGVLIYKVKQ